MTTIYYAHCMAIYNTPQEARDVALLEALGFAVCNPNAPAHAEAVAQLKGTGGPGTDVMPYFLNLVARCDALAFRALPGGILPAGVAAEITAAYDAKLSVIELPSWVDRRAFDVEETREYLREVGQR